MLDKMSDVSRIVDRLCKKGLVDSNKCSSDKRLVDVNINEDGLKMLKEMDKTIVKMESMFNNLSKDEQVKLNELLDKIRDNGET
jgi:DNA-binding MarR family transcriptional regulator